MSSSRQSDETLPFRQCKPRVLVADDEAFITTTLSAILKVEGFDVSTAAGGEEAVAKAREWRPDLVLSDVLMPDLDGIAACIRIVKMLPACKIVLFSGHAVVYDLMKTAGEHGYEFDLLLKPVHPVDLIQHLRQVLERR